MSSEQRTRPGNKGPYKNLSGAKTSYEQRLAARFMPQPPCACGCDGAAAWDASRSRWAKYAPGHYRQNHAYKNADWLRAEYVDKRRTTEEIAADFGVSRSVIRRWANRNDIPLRSRSESRAGRKIGPLNPSWKGGIADWDYAHDWKALARKIRDRDEWTCQMCGEQRKRWGNLLHVHHIDGDKLNNDPLNLISVCATCHPRGAKEVAMASTLRAIAATRGEVI